MDNLGSILIINTTEELIRSNTKSKTSKLITINNFNLLIELNYSILKQILNRAQC